MPVQSVVEIGGKFSCWVKTPGGIEKRPVVLGMSNNTRIEIKDGLTEGEQVLLNPRAVVPEAREEAKPDEDRQRERKVRRRQGENHAGIGDAPAVPAAWQGGCRR